MSGHVVRAAGTGTSISVNACQSCGCDELRPELFIGYIPPVNQMRAVGERPTEQPSYPAQILYCPRCSLVQLGVVVDPEILFAKDYPYTSGTTKILHDNFDDLAQEAAGLLGLSAADTIMDIGSNDGTLLSKFAKRGFKVLGIEPTDAGKLAIAAGIPTVSSFFHREAGNRIAAEHGKAKVVTCANCFAHIENVHDVIEGVLALLPGDGAFISESHYLVPLLDTLQYDTIYHEHLRYYSLSSLKVLLDMHGLEIFHARSIPSHGGSIRVYAARRGQQAIKSSVSQMLKSETHRGSWPDQLAEFRRRVSASKLELYSLLEKLKKQNKRIIGIGAPSRASTMITYLGLDADIVDCVGEVSGSRKIGRYMPGTLIPVRDEGELLAEKPDVALIFSWHIAEELIPKLRARGFSGQFLVPLPEPRLV